MDNLKFNNLLYTLSVILYILYLRYKYKLIIYRFLYFSLTFIICDETNECGHDLRSWDPFMKSRYLFTLHGFWISSKIVECGCGNHIRLLVVGTTIIAFNLFCDHRYHHSPIYSRGWCYCKYANT